MGIALKSDTPAFAPREVATPWHSLVMRTAWLFTCEISSALNADSEYHATRSLRV